MKKIYALFAVAALAFSTPIFAQQKAPETTSVTVPAGSPAPVAIGVTSPGTPVIVQPQAVQPYSFEGGTFLASLVNWIWVAFGGTIVTAIALGVQKFMKAMGIQTNQAMNDRLEEAIRNGMNDAAARAQTDLNGKFSIEVKNKIIAEAIEYAKAHQTETIKALGLDPKSGEVVEALRAKAETVIIDPLQATNPGLVANPNDATATPVAKTA